MRKLKDTLIIVKSGARKEHMKFFLITFLGDLIGMKKIKLSISLTMDWDGVILLKSI